LLPIILTAQTRHIGLIAKGDALERRRALLAQAGVQPVLLRVDADDAALARLHVLFVAGLGAFTSESLFNRTRNLGVLLNVEDAPELCDFHVPAIVRRGDLLLTVSTGGQAPALARQLREWLAGHFGPEWSDRLAHVREARQGWRADGLPPAQVSERTRALVTERGWL
jgi:precorrin-2 dehydrogenase/sirohydrochlorin ferrochelatase